MLPPSALPFSNPLTRFLRRRVELPAFASELRRVGVSLAGARLLDVEPRGDSTSWLAREYRPRELTALTASPGRAEQLRRAACSRVVLGRPAALPLATGSIDGAFVTGGLGVELASSCSEIERVCRGGGVLVLQDLHARMGEIEDAFRLPLPPRRTNAADVRAALAGAGFRLLVDRALPWTGARLFIARC